MELKLIELKKIHANPLQPRQEFDREKLQELANSIKEGELLQPIVVRKQEDKFEVVAGERRFKAFQILKEPKIPAIVREIEDDTDALSKSCIENWQRVNLNDRETDNAIKNLVKSKRYNSPFDLAKKHGVSEKFVLNHIDTDEFIERVQLPKDTSHTRIRATKGLATDEIRKKAIEVSTSTGISARKLEEEIVPKLKEFPEPEQQMEILEEFEQQEDVSRKIFDDIIKKKKEIADGLREPEHIIKIETDNDKRMIEDYYEIKNHVFEIVADHIKHFKTKESKDESIKIIQDIITYLNKQLEELGINVVVDINEKKET